MSKKKKALINWYFLLVSIIDSKDGTNRPSGDEPVNPKPHQK